MVGKKGSGYLQTTFLWAPVPWRPLKAPRTGSYKGNSPFAANLGTAVFPLTPCYICKGRSLAMPSRQPPLAFFSPTETLQTSLQTSLCVAPCSAVSPGRVSEFLWLQLNITAQKLTRPCCCSLLKGVRTGTQTGQGPEIRS